MRIIIMELGSFMIGYPRQSDTLLKIVRFLSTSVIGRRISTYSRPVQTFCILIRHISVLWYVSYSTPQQLSFEPLLLKIHQKMMNWLTLSKMHDVDDGQWLQKYPYYYWLQSKQTITKNQSDIARCIIQQVIEQRG